MTEIENEIYRTLLTLEAGVRSMATATPKPDLRPLFARLDELTGQLPTGTERDLLHYLHRKSYEKARVHLEERGAKR